MKSAPARSPRHTLLAGAAVAVGLLGVMPGVGIAHATNSAGQHHGGGCPAAESLVPHTAWHNHKLAPGIVESAGVAKDSAGTVNMHVLRVDLTKPSTSVRPLVHSLAERSTLSRLAQHHPKLVAATNTGYFDFRSGAPTDPLIAHSSPLVLSNAHQPVVGLGKNGRFEAGDVWSGATVTAGGSTKPLVGVNEVYPPDGIGIYDHAWGAARVPSGWSTVTRSVVHNSVSSAQPSRNGATVPAGGYLLQARGRTASSWLSGLSSGTKVSITRAIKTTAKSPFVQAYGVGVQLVAQPGVAKTGFSCNSSNTKTPARTAIGWTHGGRDLVIAIVADHPHTSMHGLDEDQMSRLMVQLGVSQAYAFDGSGSTELLAKLPGASGLTLQNYPADGVERPMPLGMGFSYTASKRHHHHKHH